MNDFGTALQDIETTADLLAKALKLAGLVTALFRKAGWELVVVGGSAVEFYTEGAYMSGDIDLCRQTLKPVPLRTAQDIMGQLNATGGPRSWKVAGMFVDLLGLLENESRAPCREVETPYGSIRIVPVELSIVERVLLAYHPRPDRDAADVAKKLLATCLGKATPVDWDEVNRLAALPAYGIAAELESLCTEVKREIEA